MGKFLKSLLNGTLLSAFIYVVVGVVLILYPDLTMNTLVLVGASCLIGLGVINLIRYIFRGVKDGVLNNLMVSGIAMIIIGIMLLYKPNLIIDLVPTILGILLMIEGLVKLQRSVDLARMKYEGWIFVLLLAVVSIVVSVVVLMNPFSTARGLVVLIGAGLVFGGVTGIVVYLIVSGRLKKMGKLAEAIQEAEKSRPIEGQAVETAAEAAPVYENTVIGTVSQTVYTDAEAAADTAADLDMNGASAADNSSENSSVSGDDGYVPGYKR